MTDYKKRVLAALEKNHKRNLPRQKRSRPNKKPEEETNKELVKYFSKVNWSMHRYESKAVYSEELGEYMHSQLPPGHPDFAGCLDDGLGSYVESKAKGKRSTISVGQYEFLIEKIRRGCFGACVDSADYLDFIYRGWKLAKNKQKFLISHLHKPKALREELDFSKL